MRSEIKANKQFLHGYFKRRALSACVVSLFLPTAVIAADQVIDITTPINSDVSYTGNVTLDFGSMGASGRKILADKGQHVTISNSDPNGTLTFNFDGSGSDIGVGQDASLTFDASHVIFNNPGVDLFWLSDRSETAYTDIKFTGDLTVNNANVLTFTGQGNPSYPKGIRFDVAGNISIMGGAFNDDCTDGSELAPLWIKWMNSFHAGSLNIQNLSFSKKFNVWGTSFNGLLNWGTPVSIDRDVIINQLSFAGKSRESTGILNETSKNGETEPEFVGQATIDIGGNLSITNLTSEVNNNGSLSEVLAGVINKAGSIKVQGITTIQNLSTVNGDVFGVQNLSDDSPEVAPGRFTTTALSIDSLSSEKGNVYGIVQNAGGQFEVAKAISITNLDAKVGEAIAVEASDMAISGGLTIDKLSGKTTYSIVADPTAGAGIQITGLNNVVNHITGDMITLYSEDPKTQEKLSGKILAEFNGSSSGFMGSTILKMDETAEAGTINFAFKNKAKWTVTKNSELSALDMQDGVLAVDINLTDGAKDGTTQVNVNGAAQGTFDVALNITGAAAADFSKSEDWFLAQESGTLTVGKVTYQNGGVLAYDVKFFEEGAAPDAQGTSSSTGNKGQWHVVLGQSTPDKPINPDNPPVTPEAKQVLSLGASVSQGLGMLSESEDLRMRMGEVRNGVSDGLWTRTYARKDGAKGSFGKEFKQDTYGIYLGADRVVAIDDDSSWLLGGAFHYGRSDMEGVADANGGSSDLDQYSIKAYATYMQESGSFADIVLHAGYYDTDITGKANNGFDAFSAKYHNWGYGISAEVGHRFTVGETSHGWFIEPTAQLTWFHSEGKDFKTSTKLSVSQSDADFVTGRLGALIGKTIAYGPANNPMEKYVSFGVKGGLLYQFDGDQSIKMHGTENASVKVDAMDLNGARGYYGVNAEWAANKSWRIYGQVSREEGNGYTKDFDVSIGARYEF